MMSVFSDLDEKIDKMIRIVFLILLSPLVLLGYVSGERFEVMKEPQKDFEDLTPLDIARMIDAYLNGENDWFYDNAFNEFRDSRFKNQFVETTRRRIFEIDDRTYNGCEENNWRNEAGRVELEAVIRELNAMGDQQPTT